MNLLTISGEITSVVTRKTDKNGHDYVMFKIKPESKKGTSGDELIYRCISWLPESLDAEKGKFILVCGEYDFKELMDESGKKLPTIRIVAKNISII